MNASFGLIKWCKKLGSVTAPVFPATTAAVAAAITATAPAVAAATVDGCTELSSLSSAVSSVELLGG
ncbi:hypothetical protein DIPPA_34433 [Diplonema papillatum]|nr:hypothetical protein DIPPA_34433 [Diplonema papillatum]